MTCVEIKNVGCIFVTKYFATVSLVNSRSDFLLFKREFTLRLLFKWVGKMAIATTIGATNRGLIVSQIMKTVTKGRLWGSVSS